MKKPRLIINTDDEMSMNSEFEITVDKTLNRIDLKHRRQNGHIELIQLFPGQVKELTSFLTDCKIWIESGYKEKLRP